MGHALTHRAHLQKTWPSAYNMFQSVNGIAEGRSVHIGHLFEPECLNISTESLGSCSGLLKMCLVYKIFLTLWSLVCQNQDSNIDIIGLSLSKNIKRMLLLFVLAFHSSYARQQVTLYRTHYNTSAPECGPVCFHCHYFLQCREWRRTIPQRRKTESQIKFKFGWTSCTSIPLFAHCSSRSFHH